MTGCTPLYLLTRGGNPYVNCEQRLYARLGWPLKHLRSGRLVPNDLALKITHSRSRSWCRVPQWIRNCRHVGNSTLLELSLGNFDPVKLVGAFRRLQSLAISSDNNCLPPLTQRSSLGRSTLTVLVTLPSDALQHFPLLTSSFVVVTTLCPCLLGDP